MDYYKLKISYKIKCWILAVVLLPLIAFLFYYITITREHKTLLIIYVPLYILLIIFYIKLPSFYKLYLSEKEIYYTTPVSVIIGCKWKEIILVKYSKNKVYLYTTKNKKIVVFSEWENNQKIWIIIYEIIYKNGNKDIFDQSFINLINDLK